MVSWSVGDLARRIGKLIERDLVFLEPELVGLAAVEARLSSRSATMRPFDGIDQQHLAGLQAALHLDVFGLDREHAGFRGHDDQVVVVTR